MAQIGLMAAKTPHSPPGNGLTEFDRYVFFIKVFSVILVSCYHAELCSGVNFSAMFGFNFENLLMTAEPCWAGWGWTIHLYLW